MATDTSRSLLDRLRADGQPQDWDFFCQLYQPLIRQRLLARQVADADVDDLVQEILARVVRGFPGFVHNGRAGAFRTWLGTIVARQVWRHFQQRDRDGALLRQALVDPDEVGSEDPAMVALWNDEHDGYVVGRLMKLIQPEFSASTWEAFRLTSLEGLSPDEAARQLGLTGNAVAIARSRVFRRLRALGKNLTDAF